MNKESAKPINLPHLSIYMMTFMIMSCENPLSDITEDFGELSFSSSMENWDGWSSESHGEDADADYDKLFRDEYVQRIDITIDEDYYQLMEDDMETNYGTFGSGGGVRSTSDDDPIYVPVTVEFNPADGSDEERTWWYVGMRYKGNSSLRESWEEGMHKLPFRLNFDYFDYIYDEIEGQRFWGFEKMTFSNGYNDDSLIRDKMASDLFQQGGIEAAEVAFCRVYIDTGDGPVYWGLYSMIEDPSDNMLDEQFADGSGNLYKPDDENDSTLSYFNEDLYPKANNEDADDWDDIENFIDIINECSSSSTDTDWQSDMETVFDVNDYLGYLAINNVFQNWDVYGSKAHNYYLYADPNDSNRFSWFPWDMNEAFTDDSKCLSLYATSNDYNDDDWPLLSNVMSQTQYVTDYIVKLETLFPGSDESGIFVESDIQDQMQAYSDLISDCVIGDENGEIDGYTWLDDDEDFTGELSTIQSLITTRFTEVKTYLTD